MSEESNVIPVDFSWDFFDVVLTAVTSEGPEGAIRFLISHGEHPAFAKAIVKKAVKARVAR